MNDNLQLLVKYFPSLNEVQLAQFEQLGPLFTEWNEKINLVSRKDIENLYERHILHSLAIARVMKFNPGSRIMDVGTGGGFPGIPLAIMFPDCKFYLVDSIGKKIKVVQDIAEQLDLKNVKAFHSRAEDIDGKFDFITGRAVTDMHAFYGWVRKKINARQMNALPNGILYLKGGDLKEELAPFHSRAQLFPIQEMYPMPFFETKYVVYIEAAG